MLMVIVLILDIQMPSSRFSAPCLTYVALILTSGISDRLHCEKKASLKDPEKKEEKMAAEGQNWQQDA